jgi:hypothetical protein
VRAEAEKYLRLTLLNLIECLAYVGAVNVTRVKTGSLGVGHTERVQRYAASRHARGSRWTLFAAASTQDRSRMGDNACDV